MRRIKRFRDYFLACFVLVLCILRLTAAHAWVHASLSPKGSSRTTLKIGAAVSKQPLSNLAQSDVLLYKQLVPLASCFEGVCSCSCSCFWSSCSCSCGCSCC